MVSPSKTTCISYHRPRLWTYFSALYRHSLYSLPLIHKAHSVEQTAGSPEKGSRGAAFIIKYNVSLSQYLINIQLDKAPRRHNIIMLIWISLHLSNLVFKALNKSSSHDFLRGKHPRQRKWRTSEGALVFTACSLPVTTKDGLCIHTYCICMWSGFYNVYVYLEALILDDTTREIVRAEILKKVKMSNIYLPLKVGFDHWIISLIKSSSDGPASLLVIHTVGKRQAGMPVRVKYHAEKNPAQISLIALKNADMHLLRDVWAYKQNTLGGRHGRQICDE